MRSKEEQVMELFFEQPTRRWQFTEILKEADITRSKADHWLKMLIHTGLIKRKKEKKKMPYYISNYTAPEYKNKKKIFALHRLHESGLLNHLYSLKYAKTVLLFGSFSRSDWYKNSDIDLFIYGNPHGLHIAPFELKLQRDIQLFICQNKMELNKLGHGFMRNIIKGNLIKGDLDFLEVSIHA